MDQSEIETEQFLMAKSCGRLCAIAKPRVAAVLTADEFVRLAYLPRPLSGIGQYSGHAILIADMGQLLGLKRRSEHIVKFWIVVSERNRQVVLQIDDVFGFEPLVPLAVARKHRLLAGSFTSSDQKTGDIINVSAFLDSVFSAADGQDTINKSVSGVSGVQVQQETAAMLTMLTFLVNGSPFSIDIDQVLRVSLLRNHDFIGTKQRNGAGTIIFDDLVCPYLGGDAPICLVLVQLEDKEDQQERAPRVFVVGADGLASISHVAAESVYKMNDRLDKNEQIETGHEDPVELLEGACVSGFSKDDTPFKIINPERLAYLKLIQENAPRPDIQQIQLQESDAKIGYLKIPTQQFSLLLAFTSLRKITSMDSVDVSPENGQTAWSHVEISGEVMAVFNLMAVLGIKDKRPPAFIAVLSMDHFQVALTIPDLSATFLHIPSSLSDAANDRNDAAMPDRNDALFHRVSAQALKVDETLCYLVDPHSLQARLKDLAI